ncbi:type II secretion system F family protein [Litorimonas sp. WD9-15]|uniref:type II secretion system F family protein n=1 Tax=Litorimonas sp. WD9-15 TaxID=3418716 RepID=UPI003D059E19
MSSTQQIIIYGLIFCAGFLMLQTILGLMGQAGKNVRLANDRLRRLSKSDDKVDVLDKMRRARSLTKEGQLAGLNTRIAQLIMQSGLPLGTYGFYYASLGFAVSLGMTLFLVKGTPVWGFLGFGLGSIAPVLILSFFVKRRRKKAVAQLPEALDIIIRSLAAGHPVPVAMGLVAREMPDPIGSEFGIASDEVSFGSTISSAIQKLADRVGHEDFELFSAMIRLQERTGGNLADLLRSNAKTIRDRQKMRLKIKAASAEGRVSAMILNVAPIFLFIAVNKMSPEFYGEVKHLKSVTYTLWGVVIWMGLGNLVMYKMINFKI